MAEAKVLVVCLGNICRSPMGEAVLQHLANERGASVQVDSCGTAAYHVGERPDERSIETCVKHEVPIDSRARQLQKKDFDEFDIIVGMDEMNMRNIEKARPKGSKAKVALFGSYGDGKEIIDPYYGGLDGFEKAYKQCVRYSEGVLAELGYEKQGGKI